MIKGIVETPYGPSKFWTEVLTIDIDIKLLPTYDPSWGLPAYAKLGDSGVDVFTTHDIEISPMDRQLVKTGICVAVPIGFEIQVRPKSGRALKEGITVLNTPGTVDSGYRNEIGVILSNTSKYGFSAKRGQKIAQFVCCPVMRINWNQVEELIDSDRGLGGFGSTGV
jgi:dUTP pyrophosphatase